MTDTHKTHSAHTCWCETEGGMEFHDPGAPHIDRETGRPVNNPLRETDKTEACDCGTILAPQERCCLEPNQ